MSATTTKRQYHYSAGKRKTAVARVKIFQEGSGDLKVNGMKLTEYFSGMEIENATAPLKLTETHKILDADISVEGGGKSAQSGAVRHGLSRALLLINPEWRSTLKREGFLRRDARVKERKKPGLKRARRAPQFSKR